MLFANLLLTHTIRDLLRWPKLSLQGGPPHLPPPPLPQNIPFTSLWAVSCFHLLIENASICLRRQDVKFVCQGASVHDTFRSLFEAMGKAANGGDRGGSGSDAALDLKPIRVLEAPRRIRDEHDR